MPWVRLDDRFPSHRKVRLLSDPAFRLYVSAVCWSAENLTDGVIGTKELRLVSDVRSAPKRAQELVDHGLWDVIDGVGWRIHDYLEYNPSAEKVRADRKAKTARQQRWRDKSRGDDEEPDGADVDAYVDASTDTSRDAAPTRPDPHPSPVGTGGCAPDRQSATAHPSLRSGRLLSETDLDHLPSEGFPPVVGTATPPGADGESAGVEHVGDPEQAKRHHMQGCGRCQTGRNLCPEGRALLLAASGLWLAVPDEERRLWGVPSPASDRSDLRRPA